MREIQYLHSDLFYPVYSAQKIYCAHIIYTTGSPVKALSPRLMVRYTSRYLIIKHMMKLDSHKDVLVLVARVSLAAIFVIFGFTKIGGFAAMVAYSESVNLPFPELGVAVALVVELVGGLMILFGFKTRLAALAIAILLIPINVYFHMNFADQLQMTMFMKNLAIFGGMLMLAAYGAGKYSVDAMMAKPKMSSM